MSEVLKISLLGCGSLSLGLIAPWLSRLSGCSLCVMTRSGSKEVGELQTARRYQYGTSANLAIEDFSHDILAYDPLDLDARAALACVAELERSDIAAVSVRVDNLGAAARLIARSCLRRGLPPLHVLAFENAPQASSMLLKLVKDEAAQLRGGRGARRDLIAHAAIPDRACRPRRLGKDGVVLVEAERFGEIILADSARSLFPEILDPQPPDAYIRYVPSNAIPLAEQRKFWLVNGTHTALGILCIRSNLHLLVHGLSDPVVAAILHSLHEEWVHILQKAARDEGWDAGVFTATELAVHAERMFDRLRDLPEFSVRDVLRELTELADPRMMQRLIQKLDNRLAEAVRKANEFGDIAVPASGWVLASGLGTVREHADTYIFGGARA